MLYVERNNAMAGSQSPAPRRADDRTGAPLQSNGSMTSEAKTDTNGAEAARLDYRDDLRGLLDKAHAERGLTRYRLCKQMGIDSGTLSNVLAKRRHFSLEKLEQILGLLGYRLSFTQNESGAVVA
jgi:hypothetical protein